MISILWCHTTNTCVVIVSERLLSWCPYLESSPLDSVPDTRTMVSRLHLVQVLTVLHREPDMARVVSVQ